MGKHKSFHKKTVRDIDLANKTVLVRVDFNVPLDKKGAVADTYRIEKAIPTIDYLLQQNCRVALLSHLGRPKGKHVAELSTRVVADKLNSMIDQDVGFVPEAIGPAVAHTLKTMKPGSVVMLENVRFYPEETDNDPEFARQLTQGFDYFVQNAFGVVHREHASTAAAAHAKPSVAGFLVEDEVEALTSALEKPKKPVVAVVGGAKIHTKLELLKNLIRVADTLVVGGAMANTFLVALRHPVGKSLYEEDEIGPARTIREAASNNNTELILPAIDVAVGKNVDASEPRREVGIDEVQDDDIILDFGSKSMRHVLDIIDKAGTVLWNGPLGMTELPQFAKSTEALAEHMIDHHVDSIVGGGDTAGFVHERGLVEKLTHVSTGGGASLELLSGKKLPGIEALLDK